MQKDKDVVLEAVNERGCWGLAYAAAELQADKLLQLAQGRAHAVEGGILELRALRTLCAPTSGASSRASRTSSTSRRRPSSRTTSAS